MSTFPGIVFQHSSQDMGPPLAPSTIGHVFGGSAAAPIRVELFLDLICPFSSKMWKAVHDGKVPGTTGDNVCFIINQVPQPWHGQGCFVHEAALAVKEADPALYPAYVTAVFNAYDAGKFKDDTTWEMSRSAIYSDLLDIAASVGIDRAKVASLLAMKPGGGNSGNSVTQAMKWVVKYQRCRGVHVTPTVHVNGLEAGVVSSGWTSEQWLKFLEPLGADNFKGEGI